MFNSRTLVRAAILVLLVAAPVASTGANAMQVRVGQVSSTVSTTGGGFSSGVFGKILDAALKAMKDKQATEKRNDANRPL